MQDDASGGLDEPRRGPVVPELLSLGAGGHGSGHGCRNRQGWVSSEFEGNGQARKRASAYNHSPIILARCSRSLGQDLGKT
jgi:hypothetical protein